MAKTQSLTFRPRVETRAALEQAATAEDRSLSAMIEKALAEWLRANGYLKERKPQ